MAIYVTSDLHGQYNTFVKGLKTINFSESDKLYVIGDVIDRGRDGIRILQFIMEQENIDLIIGNHEFLMINSVKSDGRAVCKGRDSELWLEFNGGSTTFDRYIELDWSARRKLLKWLRSRYVIRTLNVNGKDFCLSHSYYYPEYENKKVAELPYEIIKNIVWPSMFYDDSLLSGNENIYSKYRYTFVTGHIPVQLIMHNDFFEPYIDGNFIDIDGGCAITRDEEVRNGAIFLRLDDMKAFPIILEEDEYE